MLKSPLPYLGKKEKYIEYILPYIGYDNEVYLEPFCGSCSVLIALLQTRPRSFKDYIVSDINQPLVDFWIGVKRLGDEINIEFEKFTKDFDINFVPSNDMDRMLDYITRLWSGYFCNTSRVSKDRLDRFKSELFYSGNLDKLAKLLDGVTFVNLPYQSSFDVAFSKGKVECFADPPYKNTKSGFNSWYASDYISLTELKENLDKCSHFVLSHSNDIFIESIFKGYDTERIEVSLCSTLRGEIYIRK